MHESYVLATKARRSKRLRFKIYIWGTFFLVLLLSGFYFLRTLSVFRVSVLLKGLDNGEEKQFLASVQTHIFNTFLARTLGQENYFSWPKEIPPISSRIAKIDVSKNFFERTVLLTVSKKNLSGIWCAVSQCFWFDNEGMVLDLAPSTEGQLLPVIYEEGEFVPLVGAPLFPNGEFSVISKIMKELFARPILIKKLSFLRDRQEIVALLDSGLTLRFSIRFDPDVSFAAFDELLAQGKIANMNYVDFTVQGKVYVK